MNHSLMNKALSYVPKNAVIVDVKVIPVEKTGHGNFSNRMIIIYKYQGEVLRTNVPTKIGTNSKGVF